MSGKRKYHADVTVSGRWEVVVEDRDRIVSRFYYDTQEKAEAMLEALIAADTEEKDEQ